MEPKPESPSRQPASTKTTLHDAADYPVKVPVIEVTPEMEATEHVSCESINSIDPRLVHLDTTSDTLPDENRKVTMLAPPLDDGTPDCRDNPNRTSLLFRNPASNPPTDLKWLAENYR